MLPSGYHARDIQAHASGDVPLLDEAGNFDFGHSGARHFLLAGVLMRRPFEHLPALLDVKYDVLEEGLDLEYFHASEDRNRCATACSPALRLTSIGCDCACVVACKAELTEALQTPGRLDAAAFDRLVQDALSRDAVPVGGQLVVVTDSLPSPSAGTSLCVRS